MTMGGRPGSSGGIEINGGGGLVVGSLGVVGVVIGGANTGGGVVALPPDVGVGVPDTARSGEDDVPVAGGTPLSVGVGV
jgi:hypothetical protein